MKYVCTIVGLVCLFGAASLSPAAILSPIVGPAGFTSSTTFTDNFESGAPNTLPANTPAFTFETTARLGLASTWTGSITPSGLQGAVEESNNQPMKIEFTAPVSEVGMFFGNDDFGRVFNVNLELFDAANTSLGTVQVLSNGNDAADQYIGARSPVPVKSIAISYAQPNAQLLAVYIDDLKVGVAVPEPAGVALLLWGLLGLATSRRRVCAA